MKAVWIRRNSGKNGGKAGNAGCRAEKLVVFFGGFACGESFFKGVKIPDDCDVLMLCDYRGLGCDWDFESEVEKYARVGLVAWSFGLGVAESFPRVMRAAGTRVAICSSVRPLDENCGISEAIFKKTLQNFDIVGAKKFFSRAYGEVSPPDWELSAERLEELKQELSFLGNLLRGKFFDAENWTFALGALGDRIFPARNMRRAWGKKLALLDGGHFDRGIFEAGFLAAAGTEGSFEASANTYAESARAQVQICKKLSEIFLSGIGALDPQDGEIKRNFSGESAVPVKGEKILEIGCGTGILTELIHSRLQGAKWFLNDASAALAIIAARNCEGARLICADASKADLGSGYAAVVSASCFQWIAGAENFYAKLAGCLNDGGILAFSTFGKDNFRQVRELAGKGLNYIGLNELEGFLNRAGFEILFAGEERVVLNFESGLEVLRHMKETGVNGAFKTFWTPKSVERFSREYKKRFPSAGGGVELEYHPVYVLARKRGKV